MGLAERIQAWPEAMRAAVNQVAEAEAAFAQVDLELSKAELYARVAADVLAASQPQGRAPGARLSRADASRREELAQQTTEAEEAAWEARDEVNRAKAAADVQIRQEAETAGKKLTDNAVRARVQIHPDVEAAERRWREAQAHVVELRRQLYPSGLQTEDEYPETVLAADGEPYDQEAANEAAEGAADAHTHVRELQQQRVDIIHQLELAKAEVAYQRSVGKALGMLTTLAAAEIAARR